MAKSNQVHEIVSLNIDAKLRELGFGKFQLLNYLFITIAVIVSTINSFAFIMTARDTSYRCLVPECDISPIQFNEEWLTAAVPFENDLPHKCERYSSLNQTISETAFSKKDFICSASFDNTSIERCAQWVYGDGYTIVRDFDIPCEDWKRSLVGTINGIGQLVSLMYSGILSDTYGRRNMMIILTAANGFLGLIQSFSPNYWFFLVFEFLNLTTGAGAFTSAYIFGLEILSSKDRVKGSVIINGLCIFAYLFLCFFAWVSYSWRVILIATNVPAFFIIFTYWAVPESVRWLYAKGRKDECIEILKKAAKMNGITMKLENILEIENEELKVALTEEPLNKSINKRDVSFKNITHSPELLMRLVIIAFCWFTNVFVYYGVSLNAVAITGDEKDVFVNFTWVSLAEFPALVIYVFGLRWGGRKYASFWTLLLSGVACVAFAFIPSSQKNFALIVYVIGKLFISVSFGLVYIYTTELFPTTLRNSIMNFCSAFGRFGGISAPQVPLLSTIHSSVPMLTYGIIPIISAFSMLKLPETRDKGLPDTMEEAEQLG